MKKLIVLCAALVSLMAAPAYAQNPCTAALTPGAPVVIAAVGSSVQYAVTLAEFNTTWQDAASGTTSPTISSFEFAYFSPTPAPTQTTAPVASGGPFPMTKADFTLVAGTTDCYRFTRPVPSLAPTGTYTVGLRGKRDAIGSFPAVTGQWGFSVTAPFGLVPPAVPQPVGLRGGSSAS